MRILHVNYTDGAGGAARVARDLFVNMRAMGHESALMVAQQSLSDEGICHFPARKICFPWSNPLQWLGDRVRHIALRHRGLGLGRLSNQFYAAADFPNLRLCDKLMGHECFRFPGTREFLARAPFAPNIVHLHNLHGGYFDLRQLPALSKQTNVVLTLHDTWLLSGHCAYSLGCSRWETGCGHCPDLTIYPALMRDATARNWNVKADVYRRSRLNVTAPSRWALDCAKKSMLWPGVLHGRVIPNPIDTQLFTPISREQARAELGLPADSHILLLAANGIKKNRFKDWPTFFEALKILGQKKREHPLMVVGMGDRSADMMVGEIPVVFVPHVLREKTTQYFSACDLFVHSASEETFGLVIAEAMACETPVVATDVGGIPDIVRPPGTDGNSVGNGLLSEVKNPQSMAHMIERMLGDQETRRAMGICARQHVVKHFSVEAVMPQYVDFYTEILQNKDADQ